MLETPENNFLYDKKCYDSLLEKKILQEDMSKENEILVFGKLPKKAIRVPTFVGGTTTPDFIYVIENEDNVKFNLFVESKAEDRRESENVALASQKKYFENIKNIKWKIVEKEDEIYRTIEELK